MTSSLHKISVLGNEVGNEVRVSRTTFHLTLLSMILGLLYVSRTSIVGNLVLVFILALLSTAGQCILV